MPKSITKYVCQNCGYVSPRWLGKCPNCNEWSTFVEEVSYISKKEKRGIVTSVRPILLNEVSGSENVRFSTGITEFDRVLGGGIVQGSAILLGGDPGIGKSTLMLQVALQINNKIVLYITGEESAQQVKLRAERLSPSIESVQLLAETNLEIINTVIEQGKPDIVIVDSIQTLYNSQLEGAPGSVGQMRESTSLLTHLAKKNNVAIILIGHVTKEGVIAGPKVIEHVVDTVLQFEGDQHHAYRILRGVKNRFGSTNEIGIFEMRENGLREVANPSEVFLSERMYGASGASIVATMEGTRPILVEVQALVTSASYGIPQRTATGFDLRRLAMLLAVLEKRLGINVGSHDVFVNIVGGIRIDEPAVDVGVALSLVSSLRDIPVDSQVVVVGEVGLGGEIRTVSHPEKRIQESEKLGFKKIVVPQANAKNYKQRNGIVVIGVETITEVVQELLTGGI